MREPIAQGLDVAVAANVRAELARRQIRQRALAKQMGRTPGWLSRRLTGEVAFTIGELAQIAEAIGLPLAGLIALDTAA